MFGLSKDEKQKRELRKLFGQYLNIDKAENASTDDHRVSTLNMTKILFFLFCIRQDENFHQSLVELLDYSSGRSFVIDTIDSTLVKITFGAMAFDQKSDLESKCSDFLGHMPFGLKRKICGIYGIEECYVGNIGSKTRMAYTALLKNHKEKIGKLLQLEDGQIARIDNL